MDAVEKQIINPMWDDVKKYMTPPDYNDPLAWKKITDAYTKRRDYCALYSWAVADPASINFVAEHAKGKMVEMGAGVGYWAWMLSQCGVDIIAYDTAPPDRITNNEWHSPRNKDGEFTCEIRKTWYPIQSGGPKALAHHADRTLFLCWPPYDSDMAYNCLQCYTGSRLIYIGEYAGGCTGDDRFFEALDENWDQIKTHDPSQWDGMHDCIQVLERIDPQEEGAL